MATHRFSKNVRRNKADRVKFFSKKISALAPTKTAIFSEKKYPSTREREIILWQKVFFNNFFYLALAKYFADKITT